MSYVYDDSLVKIDQDRKARRAAYWKMLKQAHDEYEDTECAGYEANLGGFRYWMERKWGIQIEIIDGNYGANYNVCNEHKFLLFQMKYA